MDRGYYATENYWPDEKTKLEEPIIPINELGQTVPEKDPATGANIVQNVQAAIRSGAGNIQIVLTTPSTAAIGGRPKAYGKEVREALREMAKANEVIISGIEMPTSSISNLSGFNPQSGTISEEKRRQDMQEVKDAIQFAADVAGGGGVDIWSQEFPRTIFDAKWNKTGKWAGQFEAYEDEDKHAVKHLVDERTGRVIQEIRMNQEVAFPVWQQHKGKNTYTDYNGKTVKPNDFTDNEGNKVNMRNRIPKYNKETDMFEVKLIGWEDFKKIAKEENILKEKEKGRPLRPGERETPEEAFYKASLRAQESISRGWVFSYTRDTKEALEGIHNLERIKKIPENQRPPDRSGRPPSDEDIKDDLQRLRRQVLANREMATGQLQQMKDLQQQQAHITTAEKFAKDKAIESYAELGIHSMDESHAKNTEKPLYVGPELGWPQGWGGHPDEFIELIQKSRQKMAKDLQVDRKMSERDAKDAAARHLKGLFDTSHMGMWLNHFKKEHPQETEQQRLDRFNGWFMEQSEKLAKAGIVGGIQAVDSASGAHGHLPPGQGIFPIVESVKKFKEHGYTGFVVSEGHEEEQFNRGRILLQTWKAFGSPIASGGYPMADEAGLSTIPTWPMIQSAYFRHSYPPNFIVGAYSPSNEWKLWTETPLE